MNETASAPGTIRYQVTIGERTLVVELIEGAGGTLVARIDGGPELPIRLTSRPGDRLLTLLAGARSVTALVGEQNAGWTVVVDGEPIEAVVLDERAARLASATAAGRKGVVESSIKAPMPGLVVTVLVEPGQRVAKGAALVVLSAMKMQNELTARDDATIKDVHVRAGQTVDQGQVLVTFA
ncbi:MAG: biotin/lipoyl-binding protein [Chloroflexota bacterium]|nr:biotin/lipoyl-binding protein [Chloroflexota bacterium]